ncbi:MAG: A/G-specific adenine glycosylase [Bacteroidia bacterium]
MNDNEKLLIWYKKNKRQLPWRNTQNPYYIWLSEIILQQTRVEQGLPYYLNFTNTFKTIFTLAEAPSETVLKLWQGLGYYSRARNMHKTAKNIVEQFGGVFPDKYEKLIKLKGIGPYTAAAIASFAYNQPYAVLDGNVFRVLARYFCIDKPINSTIGKKIFTQLANEFLNKKEPAIHNQAIMELGAIVCTPANPKCTECPIQNGCLANTKKIQSTLPLKLTKKKPINRYFNYLVLVQNNKTYLKQRTLKDIWQGLFEPILIETDNFTELPNITEAFCKKFNIKPEKLMVLNSHQYKHQLTHQTIHAQFVTLAVKSKLKIEDNLTCVYIKDVEKYPTHRLFEKYLQNVNLPF